MSLTVEFYSAETEELVTLFTESAASGDDLILSDTLQTYPMAEFPGRLLLPDDLDNLCEALRVKHPLIPAHFQEVCDKEVWNDGFGLEALTLLSDFFVAEVAAFSEDEIQQAALQWAAMFPYQEALEQRPAYCSVVQLREVACDVVAKKKKAFLLYLAGAPKFFEYLRDR